MTIASEIQSLSPSSLIEMFMLDMTNIPGQGVLYFHAGTNGLNQPLVWQGTTYSPMPIEATGFDITGKGQLPRPHVKVANVGGMLSSLVASNSDLVNCKLTRRRTFARFLDAVNFPGGVNATADQNQYMQDEMWFVERKVSEDKYLVEWELASAFDLQAVQLPYRQIIQNTCPWKYRGPECGWADTTAINLANPANSELSVVSYNTPAAYYDANDQVTNQAGDTCSKRLSSCKIRFGQSAWLPYGGFPGAMQYA